MTRKTALLGTVTALASATALTPAISAALADQAPVNAGSPMTMVNSGSPQMKNAIPLRSMPRASARFFEADNGDLAVKLKVTGVTPGSAHSIDIEKGHGPTTFRLGADVVPAATVQANATGQISQTVNLGRPARRLPRGPLTFTLRQGVTANVMDGGSNPLAVQGLASTQLPRHIGRHGTSRTLRPVSESGNPLRGWASYSYNANNPNSATGQSVTVTIKASGFVPGTAHAAHVHSGTCAAQGGVVVMLPDLKADAHGRISATDTVPVTQQPQGPLYINIHEGDMNTILDAAGNPTLAFRPLLCGDVSSTQPATSPTTTTTTTTSPAQTPVPFSGTHS